MFSTMFYMLMNDTQLELRTVLAFTNLAILSSASLFKVTHLGIQTWQAQWPVCAPTHDFKGTNLLK